MNEAVIVDVVRTASGRGKPGGALSGVHPVDLLSEVLQALVDRNGIDPMVVDDVFAGCVSQAGEQSLNIGRNAVLAAGWPEQIPATSMDRQCGSSQQASHFAAQSIMAGAQDVVIACGVESMSRVPMGMAMVGRDPLGPKVAARYPEGLVNQGVSAELIAAKWGLSRAQLDDFSARSHELAARAASSGAFDNEIVPVMVTGADGSIVEHRTDETVRAGTTSEGLAGLKPSFATEELAARFPQIEWQITPGNSSPLTDGASAALIMSAERAKQLGLKPRARFHSFAVVGDDPLYMLTAPAPATRKVLAKAGLSISDIDAFEVNEAFASVPLMWLAELGAPADRLNPRGGAIALGHPLG
ncbi:MAG: acetyl-CoA C-acyltransferase, partial [Actinobacteria bacterium]|nr:acetyl-CoA C-acyltransferase [Actinomycetota bacterium]